MRLLANNPTRGDCNGFAVSSINRTKKRQIKRFMVYFLMSSVAEGSWTPSVVKVANLKNVNTLSTNSLKWKQTNLQTTENKTKPKRKTKKTATTTRKGVVGIVLVVTSSKWSGLAMSLLIKICIEKLCQELDYVSLVDVLIRIYFHFFFLCFMNSLSKQANSLNRIRYVCCLHYLSLSSTLLEVCIIIPYLALC